MPVQMDQFSYEPEPAAHVESAMLLVKLAPAHGLVLLLLELSTTQPLALSASSEEVSTSLISVFVQVQDSQGWLSRSRCSGAIKGSDFTDW